ncbi:unnamed protein product [Cylindrotheca closterium]|uniref:Uncharacterized protein n=1 Tax=Cylindrotheca closterium TaxID=2856 RepID=A0AAD2CRT3_9STRA|nr:unnamed protein product [Cylindrotheca closterium]
MDDGISQLEVQVAHVENERNCHATKATDELLLVGNSQGKEETVDKSLQIAELSMEINKLKEQLNSSIAANEKLLREKEIENQELKSKCKNQERRMVVLERRNKELQSTIKRLEGPDEGPKEKSRLSSLPSPPITEGNSSEDNSIITSEDEEFEDEDYGSAYYAQHEEYEEENLASSPGTSQRKERSGSMPLGGGGSPKSPSRLLTGKEARRRASDTALKASIGRMTQKQEDEDRSISSLGYDEGSIATQKANANLSRSDSNLGRSTGRRGSDASQSQGRVPRSNRRLSDASQNHSPIAISKRRITASLLREYDSPGTNKTRAAGSMASPFRSPRFLRKGTRSNTKKGSQTPSQAVKKKPEYDKSLSTPDLMSTPRREAAKVRLQERRDAAAMEPQGSSKTSSSPRKQKENSREIKVKGKKGTYTGQLRNDMPHGVGTIVFANGDTYIGNVVNGKLHGSGTLYYVNKKHGIDRGIWRNNDRIWQ